MDRGKLRHRITIQSLVSSQDDTTGVVTESWAMFAVVFASFRAASVQEFSAAAAEASKVMGAFQIDYLAGIKRSMRILHAGSVYNIEGVLPDMRSGIDYLTLPVSEIVNG